MLGCEFHNKISMTGNSADGGRNKTAIRRYRKGFDRPLNFARVAHVDWIHLHLVRRRGGLDDTKLPQPGGHGSIPQDCRARHVGRYLFEQFHPLRTQSVFKRHEPGGVTARPRQTVDEAGRDRIADSWEYDRHTACCLQQRADG